jgi:hypothetical protein
MAAKESPSQFPRIFAPSPLRGKDVLLSNRMPHALPTH